MTKEERFIYSRVSRRGFMGATAAGTLAALTGRAPELLRAAPPAPKATADAVIVLWMAGGMAQTDVRSEAIHAVRARREHQRRSQHVPADRHRR
jgi:hypothetical protein